MNNYVEEYIPDNWVVLKITQGNTVGYKVLAGWSGGYLDSDAWRMNSGITEVEDDGDWLLFSGHSGSVYRCGKSRYGLRNNNINIYNSLTREYPDIVELMDEDTDWCSIDWNPAQ
jgi:hypothetical protein